MNPIKTIVNVGKYKFQIIDNTLLLRDEIYCRNVKIGGNYSDCISVSISYKDNRPDSASIPYIVYDPECSFEVFLDRGEGSVIMIKTLLKYIHEQIPTITEVNFQDNSNIECANETEIQKGSKHRKKGTNLYPIPLYYFSIAFNGQTWYEKHFNAKQKDSNKHNAYRTKIQDLLHSTALKSNTSFLQFLQISTPPLDVIDELQTYYEGSNTFGKFFQSMPKHQRCKLVRDWIASFMIYYLEDKFSNSDWIIELPIRITGGRKRTTKKYYCPKGRIFFNKTYRDFGIDPTDI